ncbi:cell division topological specificity factor MinE [Spirulina sp. 06S082]|uniref:cell division topological specificity factor MinE n=1 Tax=Spirulina sp. 06S082 TaxID=3110248 RepID=UPI002B218C89|nr:cell division topological specificity factor MinE [Spirulina sp. 06S082]MEA5470335.1 cell division topological specificity factor MinE [Spirulina sp. 06S082]
MSIFKQFWVMLSELLGKLFGSKTVSSSFTAKQRLKLVIAHDRSGLSAERIEAMRQEILQVVARYVDIDTDSSEFSLESDDGMTALIANLPIRRIVPVIESAQITPKPIPEPENIVESSPEPENSLDESSRSPQQPDPEIETEEAIAEPPQSSPSPEEEELEKQEETEKTAEI